MRCRLVRFHPLLASVLLAAVASVDARGAAEDWLQFEQSADAKRLEPALAALDSLEPSDASSCGTHAQVLDTALNMAPVSLHVQHLALRCAEVQGHTALAEQHEQALAALLRHALRDGAGDDAWRPIRIANWRDLHSLIALAEWDVIGGRVSVVDNIGRLPIALLYRADSGVPEREVFVDFLESTLQSMRNEDNSGYPAFKLEISDSFVESGAAAGIDALQLEHALRMIKRQGRIEDGLSALVGEARENPWAAVRLYELCAESRHKSCPKEPIDALLENAERNSGPALAALSNAYAFGYGARKSRSKGNALFDRAVARIGPEMAHDLRIFAGMRALRMGEIDGDDLAEIVQAGIGHSDVARVLAAGRRAADGDSHEARTAALALLQPSVEQGDPGALILSAEYEAALGREESATRLLERAMAQGSARAAMVLHERLRKTTGADPKATADHLRIAAERGLGDAIYAEGLKAPPRSLERRLWMESGLRANHGPSALAFAEIVAEGDTSFPANVDLARKLFGALGNSGDIASGVRYCELTLAHSKSEEERRDALGTLDELAKLGNDDAMLALGLAYQFGNGVGRDADKAKKWLRQAASGGNVDGMDRFASLLFNGMPGLAPDPVTALYEWDRCALRADVDCKNNGAWARCTVESASPAFDPERGERMAASLLGEALDAEQRVTVLDTQAACKAALGAHAEAVELETQAIEHAEIGKLRDDDSLRGMRERRALYQSGQRFVRSSES